MGKFLQIAANLGINETGYEREHDLYWPKPNGLYPSFVDYGYVFMISITWQ